MPKGGYLISEVRMSGDDFSEMPNNRHDTKLHTYRLSNGGADESFTTFEIKWRKDKFFKITLGPSVLIIANTDLLDMLQEVEQKLWAQPASYSQQVLVSKIDAIVPEEKDESKKLDRYGKLLSAALQMQHAETHFPYMVEIFCFIYHSLNAVTSGVEVVNNLVLEYLLDDGMFWKSSHGMSVPPMSLPLSTAISFENQTDCPKVVLKLTEPSVPKDASTDFLDQVFKACPSAKVSLRRSLPKIAPIREIEVTNADLCQPALVEKMKFLGRSQVELSACRFAFINNLAKMPDARTLSFGKDVLVPDWKNYEPMGTIWESGVGGSRVKGRR